MQKLKAIFLLGLFLFSQASFSLELHYCHEKLTDVSLFGDAHCLCSKEHKEHHSNHCEAPQKACQHSNNETHAEIDKTCCSSENIAVDNKADFPVREVTFYPTIIGNNKTEIVFQFIPLKAINLLPETYIPPLYSRDLRIVIQSFQI